MQNMPTISRRHNSSAAQREATKVWQRFLNINSDGIFGSGTEAATIKYQRAHKLSADGIVGPATWKTVPEPGKSSASALQKNIASTNAAELAAQKIRQLAGIVPKAMPVISRRHNSTPAQKEAAKIWQRFLHLKVDGIFGSNTEKATKTYQKSRGLTADGIVGSATWSAAAANKAPAPTPKPQPTYIPPVVQSVAKAVTRPVETVTNTVKKATESAKQATAAAKTTIDQVNVIYQKQPLWIRIATGAALVLAGVAGFKAIQQEKRKAA